MRCASFTMALVCAGGLAGVQPAHAQEPPPLTLESVLARARVQAPEIVSARLAIDEARGRRLGASLRVPSNPEIGVLVGNRTGAGSRSTDLDVGLSQNFESASRRDARVALATAGLEGSQASLEETTRRVLYAASSAYYRAVHAGQRIRLASAAEEVVTRILATADRRLAAGDIAVLDVNIARAALARVRAQRETARASEADALGQLRVLLGMDDHFQVAMATMNIPANDTTALLQSAMDRPEIRQLEAAIRQAEAEVQLGRAFAKPDYGFDVRFESEGSDRIYAAGLRITLPMFSKGQELVAVGSAVASRLRADLTARQTTIRIQLQSALEAFARRSEAVRILERDALTGLDENDQLATRSFDVGQIALIDLLLLRRETLETRVQYLDAWLEAMLAHVDLQAAAGVLR